VTSGIYNTSRTDVTYVLPRMRHIAVTTHARYVVTSRVLTSLSYHIYVKCIKNSKVIMKAEKRSTAHIHSFNYA